MIGEIHLKKLLKPDATTPFSKILCICALLSPWRHNGLDHRVSQIWLVDLSLLDWHLLMLPFDYCWPMRPSTRAHLSLCFRICPLRKCFASLHFTDNVVDLVSSVAVGLTFKDFLTTIRLVCHVLSTNRSCQTKGPKSKTEHLSAWVAYLTDPLECKLTYGWMSISVHYGNFLASLCPPES